MASRKRFTREFVLRNIHKFLTYNKETGQLIWKAVDLGDRGDKIFNKKYSGKVAGSLRKDGYREVQVRGWSFSAHRLAWYMVKGKWPDNQIDHINGIRDDNRLTNLRDCTASANARNVGLRGCNSSGHKGVRFNKQMRRWKAYIWLEGKQVHLGFHADKQSAIEARVLAEDIAGGFTDESRTRASDYIGV